MGSTDIPIKHWNFKYQWASVLFVVGTLLIAADELTYSSKNKFHFIFKPAVM